MEQNRPAFQLNLLLSVVTLILLSLVFLPTAGQERNSSRAISNAINPICWPMNCGNPPTT